MTNTILVTGGAASGKSRWAITKLAAYNDVLFLSTHDTLSEHIRDRIQYSKTFYGVDWHIVTGVKEHPERYLNGYSFVIFDSLDHYTENTLDLFYPGVRTLSLSRQRELQKKVVEDVELLHQHARNMCGCVVITTLETGFSLASRDPKECALRALIGSINQRVANISDEVYLSVSGVQTRIL